MVSVAFGCAASPAISRLIGMVTSCTSVDDACEQFATCNIRDPLWRIKDQIVNALTSYTLQAFATDEPPVVPVSMSRRSSDQDALLAQMPVQSR